jgi:hypothetical protein
MLWASNRTTTRPEDMAYCLLGLFNVNMPLLYVEGKQAFRQLQEEILKAADNYTIFTWDSLLPPNSPSFAAAGILATSPLNFLLSEDWRTRIWSNHRSITDVQGAERLIHEGQIATSTHLEPPSCYVSRHTYYGSDSQKIAKENFVAL